MDIYNNNKILAVAWRPMDAPIQFLIQVSNILSIRFKKKLKLIFVFIYSFAFYYLEVW